MDWMTDDMMAYYDGRFRINGVHNRVYHMLLMMLKGLACLAFISKLEGGTAETGVVQIGQGRRA
jgi:hypothetical protein